MRYHITHILFFTTLSIFGIGRIFGQQHQVNEFTGDFSYYVPLLEVPSADGGAVNIAASYSAGIGVNQPASEIGLGWNLLAGGAITRSVVGTADDWKNVQVPSEVNGEYRTHNGILHLKEGNCEDVIISNYKTGEDSIYLPAFDGYNVTGPINGSIVPKFLDYLEIDMANEPTSVILSHGLWGRFPRVTYPLDDDYNFLTYDAFSYAKPEFHFVGDFHDTLESVDFPWSEYPLDSVYGVPLPEDDTVSYEDDGYNSTDNRLISSKYVEYFSNQEIADSSVSNFIDAKQNATRTSSDFDMSGIGAYRITDEGGFTYHYSLPVYEYYSYFHSYPLNHDYTRKTYDDLVRELTSSGVSYTTEDSILVEVKRDQKTAMQWLLTGITGPDFIDNGDGLLDENDEGYWVSFEYELWSDQFKRADKHYGMNVNYHPVEEDAHKELPINYDQKVHLKDGILQLVEAQKYYLNKIKTSTHSALFVREMRYDEHSVNEHYDQFEQNGTGKIAMGDSAAIERFSTAWTGHLYDAGGPEGNMVPGTREVTISPAGADSVQLTVNYFGFDPAHWEDYLEIFAGDSADQNNLIGRYGSKTYFDNNPSNSLICYDPHGYKGTDCVLDSGTVIMIPDSQVTIKFVEGHTTHGGIDFTWEGVYGGSLPSVVPSLALKKIVLFQNEEVPTQTIANLNDSTSTNAHARWDLSQTEATSGKIFHTDWYETNKTAIEESSLQTIEFSLDYHLAQKYHGNVHAKSNTVLHKLSTPLEVQSTLYFDSVDVANSGKLSLNKITTYHLNHEQTTPSIKFEYGVNEDYNSLKYDQWGLYRNGAENSFGTPAYNSTVDNKSDAWSLSKVILPSGGALEVEYEPDLYEKVVSSNLKAEVAGPMRVFPILNVVDTTDGSGNAIWNLIIDGDEAEVQDLVKNLPTGAEVKVLVPLADTADYPSGEDPEDPAYTRLYYSDDGGLTIVAPLQLTSYNTHNYMVSDGLGITMSSDYVAGSGSTDTSNISHYVYLGHGYVSFEYPIGEELIGGGIRTRSVSINNDETEKYVTRYTYEGGVASSELNSFGKVELKEDESTPAKNYLGRMISYQSDPLQLPPQVGYSRVTVENLGRVNTSEGKIVSDFITDPDGYLNNEPKFSVEVRNTTEHIDSCRATEVSNYFSQLWGATASTKTLDAFGNTIASSLNIYDTTRQGAVTDVLDFKRYQIVENECGPCLHSISYHNVSIIRNFPVRLVKQVNYTDGVEFITEYSQFDEVTGAPLSSKEEDEKGGITITNSIPAYHLSAYSSMGPKAAADTNQNMLVPMAKSITYADTALIGTADFLSASVNTFTNEREIRRFDDTTSIYKRKTAADSYWNVLNSYTWAGPLSISGAYDATAFVEYNHTSGASNNANWRFTGEKTLIDRHGHLLEVKGYNDRFSANKYGMDNRYKMASANNCNYESFTFSSFEEQVTEDTTNYFFEGEMVKTGDWSSTTVQRYPSPDTTISTLLPHAGKHMLRVESPSGTTFDLGAKYVAEYDGTIYGLDKGRTYRASVWIHDQQAAAGSQLRVYFENGGPATIYSINKDDADAITIGQWQQVTLDVEVPDTISVGTKLVVALGNVNSTNSPAYFDDLQVHPIDAPMTATVFDIETGRVLTTLDNYNFATHYLHDASGAITDIKKEIVKTGSIVKVNHTDYGFVREGD